MPQVTTTRLPLAHSTLSPLQKFSSFTYVSHSTPYLYCCCLYRGGEEGEWLEVLDAGTGRKYFANTITSEVAWEAPPQLRYKSLSFISVIPPSKRLFLIFLLARFLDSRFSNRKQDNTEWWEIFDNSRGLPYYYNTV